jgi:D-alanine-D-alanine ligase
MTTQQLTLNPAQFGRVAVVMGGSSRERQVSLWSGGAVLAALQQAGIDAHAVDGIPALLNDLAAKKFDRVFIALHGPGGEDGVLQGALEALGVPYTGSGVLGSALGMDKMRSKRIWQSLGLPTPAFQRVLPTDTAEQLVQRFGLPLVVKSNCEGSTFGVTLARNETQVRAGLASSRAIGGEIFIERLIEGDECTCVILRQADELQALPIIRIVPKQVFYDFDAKYLSDDTQYLIPSGLNPELEASMRSIALQAFQAIAAEHWGRIDFMIDQRQQAWLLEANTVPGMTSHSLVPKAAAHIGIDFQTLCVDILRSSLSRGASL